MTSVIDVWRAADPDARLVSGSVALLQRPVRSVARTRSAPPHLPPPAEGQLLVVDAGLVLDRSLDELLIALRDAGLSPAALIISGMPPTRARLEAGDVALPVVASGLGSAQLTGVVGAYLADEAATLARLASDLRLACAEAALADPEPSAPAGLVAARLRRGVAVAADAQLSSLHPRPAGRALAARFTALHRRLLAHGAGWRGEVRQRATDGLWLLERRIRPGASVWLFDDLPLAAVDEVAADALTITLRALMRRPAAALAASRAGGSPGPTPATAIGGALGLAALTPGPLLETLRAVALANGRVAPAARALGVHRNTVLYRLRRGASELGLDPRRPEDALRILGHEPEERR